MAVAAWLRVMVVPVITVTVAGTFPLAEAATAHRELQTHHPRGKYVLVP